MESLQSIDIKLIVKNGAAILGGKFEITHNGVPRIVFLSDKSDFSCSIVYSAKNRVWKIFIPFGVIKQKRLYFENILMLRRYIYEQEYKS